MSTASMVSVSELEQTRRDLQALLRTVAQQARSAGSVSEFAPQLLAHCCGAVGALGASLWLQHSTGWQLQAQHDWPHSATWNMTAAHLRGLARAAIQPQATTARLSELSREAADSGDYLLCWCPIQLLDQPVALIEILQRPDVRPTALPAQLKFLTELVEASAPLWQREQLIHLQRQQGWWRQLDALVRELHEPQKWDELCRLLVERLPQLAGAERVAVCWGAGAKLQSLTGQTYIDGRSAVLRSFEHLARHLQRGPACCLTSDATSAPTPEAHAAWRAYAAESLSQGMAAIPLRSAATEPAAGLLVFEWFTAEHPPTQLAETWQTLAAQAHSALATADRLRRPAVARWFEASLGRTGNWLWTSAWKWILLAGLLTAATIALNRTHSEYLVFAHGTLQPQTRCEVFARSTGDVGAVHVQHGSKVEAGKCLVELRNDPMQQRLQQIVGQRAQVEATIEALQSTRLSNTRLTAEQQTKLSADLENQRELLIGLEQQELLLRQQTTDLQVLSPISGQVITWNAAELLLARPVERGQVLLTIADLAGPWILEVPVPEARLGEVLAAQSKQTEPLAVSFVLATDPNRSYPGQLVKMATRADWHPQEHNTLLVCVDFKQQEIPAELLRPGASVSVKIHCGTQPLSYVLFRDSWQWLQREWLFHWPW